MALKKRLSCWESKKERKKNLPRDSVSTSGKRLLTVPLGLKKPRLPPLSTPTTTPSDVLPFHATTYSLSPCFASALRTGGGDLTRLWTPEEPPPTRIHQSCVSPSVCRPVRRCQLACASAKRAVDLSCLSVPERKVATREVRKGHWDRRRLRSEETEGDFSYFSFNPSE